MLLRPDVPVQNMQPIDHSYFCKTLTTSDTSIHGGFSILPVEKVFPTLVTSRAT
jgi:hypothetical protein